MFKRLFLFCFVGISSFCFSNNINVTNVVVTGTVSPYTMVSFDISWDNSWRTSTLESNWDAAWIFVKWRKKNTVVWNHATLSPSAGGGHTAPAGATISASDNAGAFLYRDADGLGNVSFTNVALRWNYVADGLQGGDVAGGTDFVEVCVFAIEMVYVPQGRFDVGSGSGYYDFYKYPTSANTYSITSEAAINVGITNGYLYYAGGGSDESDNNGPIPATFPKGYNAFYCMKYEITQEQYVAFLNKLTYSQQSIRTDASVPPNSAPGSGAFGNGNNNRTSVAIMTSGVSAATPAVYACNLDADGNYNEAADGQNIACNYLSWADLVAYLDWAGLRPMTEMEYEKACRGTLPPVPGEYAWGTATFSSSGYTISNSGADNEGIATNYSTTSGNSICSQTTPPGPVRVGIFAANASNTGRISSGATYYGIMEMSGNLYESYITAGNNTGRSFTGIHGDGVLDASGDANVTNWPGTDAIGIGIRSGGWPDDGTSIMQVSDRSMGAFTFPDRQEALGGRGGRTAP